MIVILFGVYAVLVLFLVNQYLDLHLMSIGKRSVRKKKLPLLPPPLHLKKMTKSKPRGYGYTSHYEFFFVLFSSGYFYIGLDLLKINCIIALEINVKFCYIARK